jgi:hypothetical protein
MGLGSSRVLLLALALTTAAGCGSAVSTSAAAGGHSSRSPSAPVLSPPDCISQAASWLNGGGWRQENTALSDMARFHKAINALDAALTARTGMSGPASEVRSTATPLKSAANALAANPPPACIPGFRSDLGQAMTDYSTAAADAQNSVSEVGSGIYDVAARDIRAATATMYAGDGKIRAGIRDLKAFNNS